MNMSDRRVFVVLGLSASFIIAAFAAMGKLNAAGPFRLGISRHMREVLKGKRQKNYYLVPTA